MAKNSATFVNSAASKLVEYFQRKLKIPYPLGKLDIIIHPENPEIFGFPVYENPPWGMLLVSLVLSPEIHLLLP